MYLLRSGRGVGHRSHGSISFVWRQLSVHKFCFDKIDTHKGVIPDIQNFMNCTLLPICHPQKFPLDSKDHIKEGMAYLLCDWFLVINSMVLDCDMDLVVPQLSCFVYTSSNTYLSAGVQTLGIYVE